MMMMMMMMIYGCVKLKEQMNMMSVMPFLIHPSVLNHTHAHTHTHTDTHTHTVSFTKRQQSANLSLFTTGSDIMQPVINFNETLYRGETLERKIN